MRFSLKYRFVNSAVHLLVVNGLIPSKECCNSLLRHMKAWRRNRPMVSDPVPIAVWTAPCFASTQCLDIMSFCLGCPVALCLPAACYVPKPKC